MVEGLSFRHERDCGPWLRACSLAAFLPTFLFCLGWVSASSAMDGQLLRGAGPGLSLALALGGVSLLQCRQSGERRRVGLATAAGVFLFGLGSLVCFVFARDRLLGGSSFLPLPASLALFLVPASPLAAVALILVGGGLVSLHGHPRPAGRGRLMPAALMVLAGTAGMLLLAYGLGGPLLRLRALGPLMQLSWQAAVAFLGLGCGILLATPGGPLQRLLSSPGAGGQFFRLGAPVLLIGVSALSATLCWLVRSDESVFAIGLILAGGGILALFHAHAPYLYGQDVEHHLLQDRLRDALQAQAHTAWEAQALERLPSPLLLVAGDGSLKFANRAARELLPAQSSSSGERYYDAAGQPLAAHDWPENLVSRGVSLNGLEVYWEGGNGRRCLAFYGEPLSAAYGPHQAAMLLVHDITALKAVEKELNQANQAKDEFLRIVSHELRTPLNAALGWLELIRMQALEPEEYTQAFSVMDRNLKSLGHLIDDMLDMSRIVAGKIVLQKTELALANLISVIVEAERPAAQAKRQKLFADLDLSLPYMTADRKRLGLVFQHLIRNAIKFTPEGGEVVVKLFAQAPGIVRATITDTGIGLAEDFRPFLFQRFRQADSSRVQRYGGLGLGLNIAQELVGLHGGHIMAESAGPGQGACFVVDLPCGPKAPAAGLLPWGGHGLSSEARARVGEHIPDAQSQSGAVQSKGEEAKTFYKGHEKSDGQASD